VISTAWVHVQPASEQVCCRQPGTEGFCMQSSTRAVSHWDHHVCCAAQV
jgi:hypothetical protein